ncbi:MAG: IS91 family transposase [Candidatus Entotheonellia bacterium]
MSTDKLTLQTILQIGYAAYERRHPLPDWVRKAAWAILSCRTAVWGGHVQRCPDGHVQRLWYHSCQHRMGPPCAWLPVERWLRHQRARLLACDHSHMICTLPAERHGLWLANVTAMTPLLCATVRETLGELLGDAQYLGAQPGMIAALHTWSQTLGWHPPGHGLVTGGGLTADGQWRAVHHGFLRPVRVVMAVFRGQLLAAIRQGVAHGRLTLPAGKSGQQLEHLRHKLGRTKWQVLIRERDPHGHGVLTSLVRYLRGGPPANQRLVSCAQGAVTFRYRVHGEAAGSQRRGLMTVPIAEFLRRYLVHVPAPGTTIVRCYGLYAPTKGADLARGRGPLGQGTVVQPPVLDWQTACQDRGDEHPERCPGCGRLLVCLGVILPARIPPPGDGLAEVAACTASAAGARAGWWSGVSCRARAAVWRPLRRVQKPSLTPIRQHSRGGSGRSLRRAGGFQAAGPGINSIARMCGTRCAGRPTRR